MGEIEIEVKQVGSPVSRRYWATVDDAVQWQEATTLLPKKLLITNRYIGSSLSLCADSDFWVSLHIRRCRPKFPEAYKEAS